MDKIRQVGTLTQETFQKAEFVPLKLDFDHYAIRTAFEDEEKEKEEAEELERQKALSRKTSYEIFEKKMFSKKNVKALSTMMERALQPSMKKCAKQMIESDSWMKRLIRFYEEEMGSDAEDDYDTEDGSDLSSVSETGSGSSSYSGSSKSGSSVSGASSLRSRSQASKLSNRSELIQSRN